MFRLWRILQNAESRYRIRTSCGIRLCSQEQAAASEIPQAAGDAEKAAEQEGVIEAPKIIGIRTRQQMKELCAEYMDLVRNGTTEGSAIAALLDVLIMERLNSDQVLGKILLAISTNTNRLASAAETILNAIHENENKGEDSNEVPEL